MKKRVANVSIWRRELRECPFHWGLMYPKSNGECPFIQALRTVTHERRTNRQSVASVKLQPIPSSEAVLVRLNKNLSHLSSLPSHDRRRQQDQIRSSSCCSRTGETWFRDEIWTKVMCRFPSRQSGCARYVPSGRRSPSPPSRTWIYRPRLTQCNAGSASSQIQLESEFN